MSNKKNINFKPFVIIFILIIVLIIGIQIFGEARFESILAAQGEVIDGFWSEVLIIRDEKVFSSPIDGKVKLFAGESDRLASGKKLALIENSNQEQNIYNKKAGIVSFAVDGLESKLNLNEINQINLSNFSNYKANYKHLLSGDRIKKGQPLYRVVNNFQLFLLVEVPKSQTERFTTGELIFLEEKNKDQLYEAKITNIRHNIDRTFFVIKVEQFIPQWINRRRVELNIIKNIYRGIKIPRKAVFSQLSGRGVLKVTGYNKYEFQEIIILNGNEDYVIVSGLEIGEEIITNPEDFDYGREV